MRNVIRSMILLSFLFIAFLETSIMADTPPAAKTTSFAATLAAKDIKALAEFYRDKLGFKIELLWGEPAAYAILRREKTQLHIAPVTPKFGPARVWIYVDNADAMHALLIANGAKPDGEPEQQSYGIKDFTFHDPEGNSITFGEVTDKPKMEAHAAAPTLAVKDVAASTAMFEKLGFNTQFKADEPPAYAVLNHGEVEIHLQRSTETAGKSGCVLHVSAVDEWFAKAQSAGFAVKRAIEDSPYGMRDFVVADVDGNTLLIGEPIRAGKAAP